jgi:hypothetical protein
MYARNLINEYKLKIILAQYLFNIYSAVKLRKRKCLRLKKAADQRKNQERKNYLKISLHSIRTEADEFGFSTLILLNQ